MSTYAIGDVQGCFDALRRLLDQLAFDPAKDQVWLAGDLANRGPDSASTLRFVKALGNAAVSILGNHDIHLLAVANGGKPGKRDTLSNILEAPDRDELLDWLRHRPLLHESQDRKWMMLHAGLPPQWDASLARQCAREAEAVLRGDEHGAFLERLYGDQPDRWDPELKGSKRFRFIVNCFTRLRYCTPQGRFDPDEKGAPGTQPAGLLPWFAVPGRMSAGSEIIFGHWSTLGRVHWPEHRVWGLDTGCVWGAKLSALNLESRQVTAIACGEYRKPGMSSD